MKLKTALASTALIVSTFSTVAAEKLPPGQVDFGAFAPGSSGKEFVEVNITSSLISMACKFVEKEDADIAKVLGGLQSIRVNVIGLDDSNRTEIVERAQKVRKDLDGKGWDRIVTAQQQSQDVSVYLKTRNKDTVEGLVVVVLDGKNEAVFVNVVGDIKPEQVSMLGEKFHIEPLKHLTHHDEK